MSLREYRAKRDFEKTPEPKGEPERRQGERKFVIQKHDASRLHYDLRLELEGVFKSWAVPKGPSLDPSEKRLAIQVEDHPLSYGTFEGIIPEGEYGAGEVILWDRGIWHAPKSAKQELRSGKLSFVLEGEKLRGLWTLVRMDGEAGEEAKNWLLIKGDDEHARSEDDYPITEARPGSVKSGNILEDLRVSDGSPAAPSTGKASQVESWEKAARDMDGAKEANWPGFFTPQLATLVDKVPAGSDWLHEVKFDGYRLLALLKDGEVQLYTRNENDWTSKFETIKKAIEALPLHRAILDGEVVALGPHGKSDFQKLQNIRRTTAKVYFYVFDLLYLDSVDLREAPLHSRKSLLGEILESTGEKHLRFSRHSIGSGPEVYRNACGIGLEGIISKHKDSPYVSSRTQTWQKSKCYLRQEFVVGGYTDPKGVRKGFGALLLGYRDTSGDLIYAGRVGTGFDQAELKRLSAKLHTLEVGKTAFDIPPRESRLRGIHWVEPSLVVEVQFVDWTRDGLVRQASYLGLREDKDPHEVRREIPESDEAATQLLMEVMEDMKANERSSSANSSAAVFAGIRLSNPDRVLFPEQGVTKRELASYYDTVAERILPHISDRPIALLRCPQGHEKECFFQKNYTDSIVGPIDRVELEEQSGEKATYMSIDDKAGLIQLAQLGTLELHPWGSRVDRLDRPDRLIFDLDPGPGVEWQRVVQAARSVNEKLQNHGLACFVKTSGGKGLHVVVPLERRTGWDEVKAFAHGIADRMAAEAPDEYVATASKAKRKGKIFVDYLRNSRGATNVAPYSTRAREGAPISTPLTWEELGRVESAKEFNLGNIRNRLNASQGDAWDGFFEQRQSITKKMLEVVGAA